MRRDTGDTTLEELAAALILEDPDANGGDRQERRRLTQQLAHCHVPKLEAHGVLEFDSRSGAIRYRQPDRLETVLDALPPEATTTDHPQVSSASGGLDSQTDT